MPKWIELPVVSLFQTEENGKKRTEEIDSTASLLIVPPCEVVPHPAKDDISLLHTGFGVKTVRLSYKELMERLHGLES